MTETITIRGSAILRRANEPQPGSDFRFIVRWMLADERARDRTIRLPRVVVDAGGAYASDQFRLRIYRRRRSATPEYFDFDAADFVPSPGPATETIVAPILDALLRPRSRKRWVRDGAQADLVTADTRQALWCATSDRSLRDIDPLIAAPVGALDSAAKGAGGEPERLPLAVGDLLFGAEDSAARGQIFVLLRDRIAKTMQAFDFQSRLAGAGIISGEALQALTDHLDPETPTRLALQMLGLGGGARFDHVALLRGLDARRRELRSFAIAGNALQDINPALLDCALMALSIAPRADERQGAFAGRLTMIAEQTAQAREDLAMSSAHGGRWFVYNSDALQPPLGSAHRQTDAPAGQAAGPELVGLGFVSKTIDAAKVRQWAAEGWYIGVEIDVASQAAAKAVAAGSTGFALESDPDGWSADRLGRIWEQDALRQYEPFNELVITREQLGLLASAGGTTTAPLAAPSAELFLDAVQLNPHRSEHGSTTSLPDKAKGDAPSFPTGDAAIQLLFGAESDTTTHGVNIYAVWEDGTPGNASPSLAELRPWLVNVRHSFLTEIYHAAGFDVGGTPSPEFAALLAHPPANPVLPRPKFESDDPSPIALPPVEAADPNEPALRDEADLPDLDIYLESPALQSRKTFHHDLRDGSELPAQAKDPSWAGYQASLVQSGVAWDPSGLVDEGKRARDLPALAWRGNTDRYRLFVTATDLFGQESEPVAVETHARFMSGAGVPVEEGVYRPVSRLPILDPPTDEPGAMPATARKIAYDAAGRKLVADFTTPFDNRVETGEASGLRAFMPARDVEAEIILFRRFIRPDDMKADAPLHRAFAGTGAVDLDRAWLEHIEIEAKMGFRPFHDAIVVAPPAGDAWRFDLPLPPRDHGYRYKAAIRFRLTADARKHRFPDELSRRLHHFVPPKQPGEDWTTAETMIPEIITRGRIGVTGISDAIASDLLPAPPLRAAGISHFDPAKPIGAVPGVNRDQLLAKLLSFPVAKGGTVQPGVPWPPLPVEGTVSRLDGWDGRRFMMTLAQVRMIEAALDRVPFGNRYDPAWRPFVEILAMGFAAQVVEESPSARLSNSGSDTLRLAPIIGLRGALRLEWTYEPVSEEMSARGSGAQNRVDAAMFEISEAHVPDEISPSPSPSVPVVQLDVADPAQPAELVSAKKLPDLPRAFVLRNRSDGSQYRATRITRDGETRIGIEAADRDRWLRAYTPAAEFDVFIFQKIWTVPVQPLTSGTQNYHVVVPVGGGEKETIHWRVQSLSSAHVAAPEEAHAEMTAFTSITPQPVAAFSAEPVRKPDALWLDPSQKGFYPSEFEAGDAQHQLRVQPRIALSWRPDGPSDAGVLLVKEARSLWPQAITKDSNAGRFIEAIERIGAVPAGSAIELADIDTIRSWLSGLFNWSGASNSEAFWPLLPRLPQRHPRFLPAGGLLVGGSGAGAGSCYFLDYHHDVGFPQPGSDAPIEYDHEYRYAAARYVDLGPALQGDARYLVSQASAVSAFAAPSLPEWRVATPSVRHTPDASLVAPRIRIHLEVVDERGLGASLASQMGFATEVVRALDKTLVDTGGDPHLVAIGQPLELETGAPSNASGTVSLDRIGREHPAEQPKIKLRLKVGQFLKGAGADRLALDERVDETEIVIPAPQPGFPGEVACDVEWKIFVG